MPTPRLPDRPPYFPTDLMRTFKMFHELEYGVSIQSNR